MDAVYSYDSGNVPVPESAGQNLGLFATRHQSVAVEENHSLYDADQ